MDVWWNRATVTGVANFPCLRQGAGGLFVDEAFFEFIPVHGKAGAGMDLPKTTRRFLELDSGMPVQARPQFFDLSLHVLARVPPKRFFAVFGGSIECRILGV